MKLIELELLTFDLKEIENFYFGQLGFPITNRTSDSISFKIGYSILTFITSEELYPNYHFAFNIPQNKLEEAINWATTKVSLIENSNNEIVTIFEDWKAESVYFYDNNKNIVELIARKDLKNFSDDEFKTSSIESISEIGIVSDHPLTLGEELITAYDLNFFSKGPVREDFMALGDDNGLILIARTNRAWYPTNDSAKKYYSRIKYEVNGFTKDLIINKDIH